MSDKPVNASMAKLMAAWTEGAGKSPEEISKAFEPLEVCGGALLYLNRAEAERIEQSGAGFDRDPVTVIPPDGRASVRVRCSRPIMVKRVAEDIPGSDQKWVRIVKYGLCERCSGWEMAIRKRLRDEAKKAEEQAKTGTRKRGFREEAEG